MSFYRSSVRFSNIFLCWSRRRRTIELVSREIVRNFPQFHSCAFIPFQCRIIVGNSFLDSMCHHLAFCLSLFVLSNTAFCWKRSPPRAFLSSPCCWRSRSTATTTSTSWRPSRRSWCCFTKVSRRRRWVQLPVTERYSVIVVRQKLILREESRLEEVNRSRWLGIIVEVASWLMHRSCWAAFVVLVVQAPAHASVCLALLWMDYEGWLFQKIEEKIS